MAGYRGANQGAHMIRSMTAFARREHRGEWGQLTWELRSVNHRYLEVFARLPDSLRALEPQVREQAAKRLGRGKVEFNLRFQPAASVTGHLSLNTDLARDVLRMAGEVEELIGVARSLSPMDVLKWPGVAEQPEPDLEPVRGEAMVALDHALQEFVDTREREGELIRLMIEQRCRSMETLVAEARARRPEMMSGLREKFENRLRDLPVDADPGRLEQEMVILAQRLDVDEELDRLDAHLAEVTKVLQRRDPVGRRLDFLMQELNREANTLSSKSADTDGTRIAVDMKVLIEQMREQVQNVE